MIKQVWDAFVNTSQLKYEEKIRLKISARKGTIKSMVITVSETSGIKCQVGDFSLLVDSPSGRRGSLILKTKSELPIDSFVQQEIIYGPGEYEISGVRVRGVSLPNGPNPDKKTIKSTYVVEFEGIKLAFLTEISAIPPEEALDKLGEVDILFLSVDTKKVKPKQITSLIKQLDPSIVISTTDKTAKMLAEEMGQKVKPEERLIIKRKDFVKEDIANKLVWLRTK